MSKLKELKQRHLLVSRGMKIPREIAAVCQASVDTALNHWDSLDEPGRLGTPGAPIYDAGVQLGKLLRKTFLADYFVIGFGRLRTQVHLSPLR